MSPPHNARLHYLIAAFNSRSPASGLTHAFYRYPARFPPDFVRAAIETFTKPGDLVLDPFMGSGTTLVESLAAGRHSIGTDINPLATYVAKSKITLIPPHRLHELAIWAESLKKTAPPPSRKPASPPPAYVPEHLLRTIQSVLDDIARLPTTTQQRVATTALLRTSQSAIDCTEAFPSTRKFRASYIDTIHSFIEGLHSLRQSARETGTGRPATARAYTAAAEDLAQGGWQSRLLASPKLVLTSPPYPNVHVLYNRWQVRGRKETSAPYWIIGHPDGAYSSAFTMGTRSEKGVDEYFRNLYAAFTSIRAVVQEGTILVQIVAFSQPRKHLPRYLKALVEAGFVQRDFEDSGFASARMHTRRVPLRKWYATYQGKTNSSREYLLVHRAS